MITLIMEGKSVLTHKQYLVLKYTPTSGLLTISFYSAGVIDILCLNLPNGGIAPIFNKDIFKILGEHSSSSSFHKSLKNTVRDNIKRGAAVSVELGLLTGPETRRSGFTAITERKVTRAEQKYVSHWTPCKDEEGRVSFVIMTIAPK
jgi:hypothetical protein